MVKKIRALPTAVRYVFSSVASWVVDNALYFLLLHFVFGPIASLGAVLASTLSQVLARVASSFFNYNVNYFLVFERGEDYRRALVKYYCLCIPQAAVSVLLLDVVIKNMTVSNDLLQTGLKILIETVLFAVSYLIQNKWVFGKKKQP